MIGIGKQLLGNNFFGVWANVPTLIVEESKCEGKVTNNLRLYPQIIYDRICLEVEICI